MRLLCILAVLTLTACSSTKSGGPVFGAPSMDFQPPLLPSDGGPATPVQRFASQAQEARPAAPATAAAGNGSSPQPLRLPPRTTLSTAPPAEFDPVARKTTVNGIRLTYLAFDDRRCDIMIADKEGGLNTEWQTAAVAGAAHDAIAAINGGFFTPEGKPLGLVVENGKNHGSWNASSSITSGVLIVTDSRSGLSRRERWSPHRPSKFLLQAGPLLLDSGNPVTGLSDDPERPRSFIAWDGRHHWIIGYARSATLAGLAKALATQPVPQMSLRTALNLDGGSSSDLWISPVIKGGPVSTRQIWNKRVRNYVLIRERTP